MEAQGKDQEAELRPMQIQPSAQPLADKNKAALIKCFSAPPTIAFFCVVLVAFLMVLFKPGSLSGSKAAVSTTAHGGGMDMGTNEVPDLDIQNEMPLDIDNIEITSELDLVRYYAGSNLLTGFSIQNDEGLQYVAKKIAMRRFHKQPFVIGVVGDGTLVGAFGNCETDGYVSVMERTLKPIFKAHGVDLKIHKVIYGSYCGASSVSISNCIASLVGEVDILQFSFPRATDDNRAREILGRSAGGTVHVLELSCTGNVGSLTNGKNAGLLSQYQAFGSNVVCLDDALQAVFGERYKGQRWGVVGDGLHSSVRQKPNKGILWKNWQPGPLGHQFLADVLSAYLLRALLFSGDIKKQEPFVSNKETSPLCYSSYSPAYGKSKISLVRHDSWKIGTGDGTRIDDVPEEEQSESECKPNAWCGYIEARGSAAGQLVFDIPADDSRPNRSVYICCCCNAELCVEEQLQSYVKFDWTTPVESAKVLEHGDSVSAGKECLKIAQNMPYSNRLTISVDVPEANLPIRIARVIVY